MIYIPLLVNRFQKSILLIVQYKYLKSCSKDFIPQNLMLRTRSCGTAYITQFSWLLHFHPTQMCWVEIMCTSGGTIPKKHLGGASPWIFYMIHRVGRHTPLMNSKRTKNKNQKNKKQRRKKREKTNKYTNKQTHNQRNKGTQFKSLV